MSRSATLLAAGFAVLLIGSIALWRFATRESATASASRRPTEAVRSDRVPDRPATPAVHATDTRPAAATAPAPVARKSSHSKPALIEQYVPPQDDVGVEYDINGKPIPVANLATLRKVGAQTDAAVKECLAKSPTRLTGKVMLAFIVARKFDKSGQPVVATETSSVEDDGTTIDNADVLDCLQKTAYLMKFPPNKSPIAVWARRRIIFENGLLAENFVLEFGRIH